MRVVMLAALCVLLTTGQQAPDFAPIGSFASVRQTGSDDPHCYGWSLKLWRYKGQLAGLLNRYEGQCEDPPCRALVGVIHDARTGRVTFSAFDLKFDGTLRSSDVSGTIGDERLTLKRNDHPMDTQYDNNLEAWCAFWGAVPRCEGVAELCRSLRR